MFYFGRIYKRVTGSNKGEEESEENSDADRGAERSPNSGTCKLLPVSIVFSLPIQFELTAERNGFEISWRKVSVPSARTCKLK